MIFRASLFVLLLATTSASAQDLGKRYSQTDLLRNWALSRCLAEAYPDGPLKDDATKTAGAYLEFGKSGMEVYEKIEALVAKTLAQKYAGSVKSDYDTMKCIDLFHGKELLQLARTATAKRRSR